MNITSIPPESVEFLNSLYKKTKGADMDIAEALAAYKTFLAASTSWFEQQKKVVLSDDENTVMSTITFLIQKKNELLSPLPGQEVDDAFLTSLAKIEFEIADNFTLFHQHRDRAQVTSIIAINDFLLAAWAFLNRNGEEEIMKERFGLMKESLTARKEDYQSEAHLLKEEVRTQFLFAFDLIEKGVALVDEYNSSRNAASLEAGCDHIKEGSALLEHYIEWKIGSEDRLWDQFSRFAIPLISPDLQILLEEGREGNTDNWADNVEAVEGYSLPRLRTFWDHVRSRIFAKPSVKGKLIPSINEGIENLEKNIASLKNPALEALDNYEKTLESLSSLFSSLEKATFRWDHALGSQSEFLGDLVKGLYYGTLPDFAAEDYISHLRMSPLVSYHEEVISHLQAYLDNGDGEELLWALEKFLDLQPQQSHSDEEKPVRITCTFCGTPNETTRTSCAFCKARLIYIGPPSMDQESASDKPFNVFELSLPPTAEPLVQMLRAAEQGECTGEYAAALLNSFIHKIEETEAGLASDKGLDEEFRNNLKAGIESMREAITEAQKFLDNQDVTMLHSALNIISSASVRIREIRPASVPEQV